MSNPNQNVPPQPPVDPNALGPDQGQEEEYVSNFERFTDASMVAVHGIAAVASRVRMERAGSRMERMEHKQALYSDIGNYALTGTRHKTYELNATGTLEQVDTTPARTANGEPAMPRTILERYTDRRWFKKSAQLAPKATRAFHDINNYGKPGEQQGVTPKERRANVRAVKKQRKAGLITASDANIAILKAKFDTPNHGKALVKKSEKKARDYRRRAVNPTKQYLTKPWRNMRRNRAENSIATHYYKQQKHEAAVAALRAKQEARKASS